MVRHDFNQFRASACRNGILRPLENPKKQSDGGGSGGRLNPSRLLFRLAFLSWPLVPVRRIALFFKIPEFSGSYVDRVDTAEFAEDKEAFLRGFLTLEHGPAE